MRLGLYFSLLIIGIHDQAPLDVFAGISQVVVHMVLSRLRSDLTFDLSCLSLKSQGAFSS